MVLTAAIICCSLVNILKFAGFRSKFDFPTSKHLYLLSIGKLLKFEHRSRLGWRKVCYIFNFACFLYIYGCICNVGSLGCNVAPLCAMHTYIICNGN